VNYKIRFKRRAYKEFLKLPSPIIKSISLAIDQLASNPRPEGCLKLKGSNENLWRILIGNYRVIY